MNSTATIHETISDTAMTTNRVKVNSPAALLLKADGDEARDGHQRAGQHREGRGGVDVGRRLAAACRPTSSRATIISTAIMASSTRRPSAMISAPSEIAAAICRIEHDHEGDGQHQRDRDRHHQARHACRG